MKRFVLALLLLLFFAVGNADESAALRVHDGDTFALADAKYRIWGVDAPELDQPWGIVAREALRQLLASGEISTIRKGKSWNRTVVQCSAGEKDVALELLKMGLAWYLPKPALDLPRLTRSRGAVTITGAEFRRKLGDCNLDVEKLLRKLSVAGYDVERELAELAYLCATVNRCRRGAYEFMAQIETMNHHARQLADMSYNTTYRFCRDGRIGVPETVTA